MLISLSPALPPPPPFNLLICLSCLLSLPNVCFSRLFCVLVFRRLDHFIYWGHLIETDSFQAPQEYLPKHTKEHNQNATSFLLYTLLNPKLRFKADNVSAGTSCMSSTSWLKPVLCWPHVNLLLKKGPKVSLRGNLFSIFQKGFYCIYKDGPVFSFGLIQEGLQLRENIRRPIQNISQASHESYSKYC